VLKTDATYRLHYSPSQGRTLETEGLQLLQDGLPKPEIQAKKTRRRQHWQPPQQTPEFGRQVA